MHLTKVTSMQKLKSDVLVHHGILNQKWGVRHGPPYPLSGGDYSPSQKQAIYRERKKHNSIYNKKHFDKVIRTNKDTLSTLSYNKDRLKGADMIYATFEKLDKHQYNAMFNRAIDQPLFDSDGNEVGTGRFLKYKINANVSQDMKVASEDSGAKSFLNLYHKNRDFYNFVTDPSRMEACFVTDKYKFRGYRQAREALHKMREPGYKPTEEDIRTVYRLFNYIIPNDGAGNARVGKDVATQRAKFFNELKKDGYGACLDTNDAIYGGFKASAPVIVFDMEQLVPQEAYRTSAMSKQVSKVVTAFRKAVNI